MKLKNVYLILCVLGFSLPMSQFLPWVAENGLDGQLFIRQLFANRISAFFGMDVVVSAVVLAVFARAEVRRRWIPVVAMLTVGVSLGLPLALYLRELEKPR